MIELFLPNSRALLPTFRTNCPDGSHFAQTGSHFSQIPPPTSVPYSALTRPFVGYVRTQSTPNPTPKHSFFLAWTGKWAKWTTIWAKWDPNWAICLKSGQKTFLVAGKKRYHLSICCLMETKNHLYRIEKSLPLELGWELHRVRVMNLFYFEIQVMNLWGKDSPAE